VRNLWKATVGRKQRKPRQQQDKAAMATESAGSAGAGRGRRETDTGLHAVHPERKDKKERVGRVSGTPAPQSSLHHRGKQTSLMTTMKARQHIGCGKATRAKGRGYRFVGNAVRLAMAAAFGIALAAALPPRAQATTVHGILTGANRGSGLANQVYLQDRVSRDVFIASPKADGAFSANVPPGVYDLRAEPGPILVGGIVVGLAEVNLGNVQVPRSFNFGSLFQRQRLAPAQVQVPAAPATAHLAPGQIAEEPLPSRYMRKPGETPKAAPGPAAASAKPMQAEPPFEPNTKSAPAAAPRSAQQP
jgi:hypothetical protein